MKRESWTEESMLKNYIKIAFRNLKPSGNAVQFQSIRAALAEPVNSLRYE